MAGNFTLWDDMSPRSRFSFLVSLGILLVLMAVLFFSVLKKEYGVLFNDLEPRDASSLVAELDKLKVDYKLSEDGSQVLVPKEQVHEVRLKIMGTGVPLSGGVGFEIFDNSDFGMTDFAQQINYKRALEGELTRTIMALEAVKYARVHLVLPDNGLFNAEDEAPQASVTLFHKQNRELTDQQIQGIQRLVAASVPKMNPKAVMVSDEKGVTLSSIVPADDNLAAMAYRFDQKRVLETYLTNKVDRLLTISFGENVAHASVDVVLNFDETVRTTEDVIAPDKTTQNIIRNRETRKQVGAKNDDSSQITTDTEYQLGRVVEKKVVSPGNVERISVAVLLPDSVTEANRKKLQQLIISAAGLDIARGDEIAFYPVNSAPIVHTSPLSAGLPAVSPPEAVVKQTNIPDSSVISIRGFVQQHPTQIALSALLVLVFLMIFIAMLLLRKSYATQPSRLSEQDRQAVLLKLQHWLESENPVVARRLEL